MRFSHLVAGNFPNYLSQGIVKAVLLNYFFVTPPPTQRSKHFKPPNSPLQLKLYNFSIKFLLVHLFTTLDWKTKKTKRNK